MERRPLISHVSLAMHIVAIPITSHHIKDRFGINHFTTVQYFIELKIIEQTTTVLIKHYFYSCFDLIARL